MRIGTVMGNIASIGKVVGDLADVVVAAPEAEERPADEAPHQHRYHDTGAGRAAVQVAHVVGLLGGGVREANEGSPTGPQQQRRPDNNTTAARHWERRDRSGGAPWWGIRHAVAKLPVAPSDGHGGAPVPDRFDDHGSKIGVKPSDGRARDTTDVRLFGPA